MSLYYIAEVSSNLLHLSNVYDEMHAKLHNQVCEYFTKIAVRSTKFVALMKLDLIDYKYNEIKQINEIKQACVKARD